jgi:hypothetical protein
MRRGQQISPSPCAIERKYHASLGRAVRAAHFGKRFAEKLVQRRHSAFFAMILNGLFLFADLC